MAISLTQTPAAIDAAYGANIFTLNDPSITDPFFVLEVWDGPPAVGASVLLATLYQSPNENHSSIFDVQHVIQSYVSTSIEDFDRLGTYSSTLTPQPWYSGQPKILNDATNESTKYYVRYSSTTAIGTPPTSWTGSSGPYNVFDGVKQYWDRNFDEGPLQSDEFTSFVRGESESAYNCTQIIERARALSDNQDRLFVTSTGYQKPSEMTGSETCTRHYVTGNDWATKSWINSVRLGSPVPQATIKGIEAFRVAVFNDTNQVASLIIPNIIVNGGGPNTDPFDGDPTNYPYKFVSIGTGPANLVAVEMQATSTTPATVWRLTDYTWTHYWVYPLVATGDVCSDSTGNYDLNPLGEPQLYIKKELDCLDYTPVEVSWLNRFGFRDQFTFRKRNEKTIGLAKNTYYTNNYNPSASEWESDPEYRGETVYSSQNTLEIVATTGYISDEQAATLESLFTSPDVRIDLSPDAYNLPGYSSAAFEAAIVADTQYVQKTFRKDRLFQYEIRFRLANNIKSQRG